MCDRQILLGKLAAGKGHFLGISPDHLHHDRILYQSPWTRYNRAN
jgi:hypothetical protein